MTHASAERAFRVEYGAHRASEGRALDAQSMLALPYLTTGPHAKQWAVRARTFDAFMSLVLAPLAHARGTALRVLDLGAGNGWLSWRAALAGHDAVAIDIRDDDVDGLRAARSYLETAGSGFHRVAASFEALPVADESFDVVVFNASLHYALDLDVAMAEARRVARDGGRIAILDSPFYARDAEGEAMVAEKRRSASLRFGERAAALMSLPFIEYLTGERLSAACAPIGVEWQRHRVRYPFWYETRPLVARVRGQRTPSRFDLWEGIVS